MKFADIEEYVEPEFCPTIENQLTKLWNVVWASRPRETNARVAVCRGIEFLAPKFAENSLTSLQVLSFCNLMRQLSAMFLMDSYITNKILSQIDPFLLYKAGMRSAQKFPTQFQFELFEFSFERQFKANEQIRKLKNLM